MTFLMATALCGGGATAALAEDLSLQLNWKAGGDHAPIYYALEKGWYEEAGVDLDVRQGSDSGASAKALAVGQADLAIIDTPTALQFIGNDTPIKDVLGDDLGYALLRDEGLNPYGLAYFASDDLIAEKHDSIEAMVHVTQRTFAACLEDPAPCAKALSQAVSMKESDAARELEYAARVMPGLDNPLAIGEWDVERVAADYDLVEASFEIAPFDPKSAVTNEFIDTSIKYPSAN
ncbi:MAG: hypothetical protein CL472_08460 [Acidobacteria bacterium]|nr:hypothetical protein [Acidobacteriota bacterium]|tara:strand:+ start:272 stop:973 length:702 start_codon:yes stop_codon:yes gene_type:complete